MEQDPFAVLESLTIAAFATGSEKGFIYIRGEYPHATSMLERAIDQAYARGFLGADVMGEGFAFDVELRRGAGAYICGEETSLFNSIEGKRGEPRNKPPFPVERGVFGKPTGINNVETLVNVLEVLTLGGSEYAKIGTPDSTGPRLFCLSGRVETAGRLRGRARDHAARTARAGRGRPRRQAAEGDPARRRRRVVRHGRRPRPAAHVRGFQGGRRHARLGRRDGVRRGRRPRRHRAADRRVLPRRVLRAVRALPRRDGAPGGGAGPGRSAVARTARWPTSSP